MDNIFGHPGNANNSRVRQVGGLPPMPAGIPDLSKIFGVQGERTYQTYKTVGNIFRLLEKREEGLAENLMIEVVAQGKSDETKEHIRKIINYEFGEVRKLGLSNKGSLEKVPVLEYKGETGTVDRDLFTLALMCTMEDIEELLQQVEALIYQSRNQKIPEDKIPEVVTGFIIDHFKRMRVTLERVKSEENDRKSEV